MKSTHVCEVVPVKLERHENADNLSLNSIFDGGYVCVLRTEDWIGKEKAVYIVPDSLVPIDRPEFSFLAGEKRLIEVDGKKYARIKAKKIRGVVSFGMCVKCPGDAQIGQDWAERLGILHYDPDEHESLKTSGMTLSGGDVEKAPECHFIKYDVDSLRGNKRAFKDGEVVIVLEKLDGENTRNVFSNGKMYCGSRNQWKKEWSTKPDYESIEKNLRAKLSTMISEEEILVKLNDIKVKIDNFKPTQSKWWIVLNQHPEIEKFCRDNPDCVLYSEIFGHNNRLRYNLENGQIRIRSFDILKCGKFLNYNELEDMCGKYGIAMAPLLGKIPYNFDEICKMAEGRSTIPGSECIREGVVIRPLEERYEHRVGRVHLKVVSAEYLEKSK